MLKEKLNYHYYLEKRQFYQTVVSKIASARMILFLIMVGSFIFKYYYFPTVLTIIFVLSFFSFLILVFIHDKYYKIYDYYVKYVEIIDTYLERENGEWCKFQDKGSDFLKDSPYYYKDLDLFGENSLFQFLTVCKTMGGREKLKLRLSNPEYSNKKLCMEQDAILELANSFEFIIDFCILMSFYDGKNIHLCNDFSLLFEKKKCSTRDLILAIICSFACFTLLFFSLLFHLSFHYFYGFFLFNYVLSIMYTYLFREEFSHLEKILTSYKGIHKIFKKCSNFNFSSKKLNDIKNDMIGSLESGIYLERLDTINSLRNNIIASFFCNGFFCINLILLYVFSRFVNRDLSKLKKGIADIEELEAICSLANIGIVFQNKSMPVLNEDVHLHFDSLIHPLLGESICVPNSFDSHNGVNIITGSNMGGKTSFLRTVGINLILMNSGSFVCAKSFSSSYFKIFTSMRVNDDISNGISTFYGELLRIKDMVEYVDCGNMLVLIDEIFKGTNYQDRIFGAREVIKKLNTSKTIVLLTTHDFELCEEKNIVNYHVKEAYDGDKIIFDYKIRKGQCTSTNARYLMTKLGIIEK